MNIRELIVHTKKKLVYRLGSEAGFFSEYNNMILAMLYCLKYKIRFEMYSKDANFGYKNGWEDYFLPFCTDNLNPGNHKYNLRQDIYNLGFRFKVKKNIFKFFAGINYLTFELWPKFHNKSFENELFDIPELDLKGNTKQIAEKLIKELWVFSPEIENDINQLFKNINLPTNYVGLHIRGGDKIIEAKTEPIEEYLKLAQKHNQSRNYFVLTDDYSIIEELETKFNDCHFYTLCDKSEKGYYHNEFSNNNSEIKRKSIVKLLASMDILLRSDFFIGTYSSNPGMFMGMALPESKIRCVDLDKWTIW